jgi:hypothetical protein
MHMKAAILLMLAVLAGCTTVGRSVVQDMPEIPPGKGVVLFSTGADATNLSFSTGLRLVQAETMKRYDKVAITIDYPFASDFPDSHGHVRSLTLPQGNYFLVPRSGNGFFCLVKYPMYRFTVRAGAISYIGSFQLSSRKLSIIRTYQQRDIQVFYRRNPALKSQAVVFQQVVIGRESFNSCEENNSIKGVIWEAPQ